MGNEISKIPEGYKLAGRQKFTLESASKFLNNNCSECLKSKDCEIQEQLRLAMGNNYSIWHQSFLAVTPEDIYSGLKDKVICTEYKDPQLKIK